MPEQHLWSRLNHLQVGRYAEYFVKMRFVLVGFDVYSAEVDDRGIDFVLRREPDRYWNVQVKAIRNTGYVFLQRSKFRIRSNLLAAVAVLDDGSEPSLFLIPSTQWSTPNTLFVYREYEGLKSAPEYGINLSRKGIQELEPFRFNKMLDSIFGQDVAAASDT